MSKFFTELEQHEQGKRLHRKREFLRSLGALEPEWLEKWIEQHGPYLYHGTTEEAAHKIMGDGLYPHNELEETDGPDFNVVCDNCGSAQPDHGQTKCQFCNAPIDEWAIRTRPQGKSNYGDFFRTREGHVYMGAPKYIRSHIKGGLLGIDLRKLDPTLMNPDEDHFEAGNVGFTPHPVIQNIYTDDPPPDPNEWAEHGEDLGSWANRIGLGNQPGETQYSLERGSMAYNGRIPPEALTLVGTGRYNPTLMHSNPWLSPEFTHPGDQEWDKLNAQKAQGTFASIGDGHITCKQGHTHWGRFGAAGVLFRSTDPTGIDRYLLTLRSNNVMEGGCWGIPGGAINSNETPLAGALREAHEEINGIGWIESNIRTSHVNDHGEWKYTTIVVDTPYFIASVNKEAEWETDDVRWFTAAEVDQLAWQNDLHTGFSQTWERIQRPHKYADTNVKDRVQISDSELHVGLEIPRHTAKAIYRWARDQQWPEGTKLEPPGEYHSTLMYSPSGYDEHREGWWLEHLNETHAHITGVKSFSAGAKGYAYVLTLESPEIQEKGEEMQNRAKAMGLHITDFPGGYRPHITIAYGPTKLRGIEPPKMEVVIGPSSVSPPRTPDWEEKRKLGYAAPEPPGFGKGTAKEHCGLCTMYDHRTKECWGYGDKKVESDDWCESFERDPKVKTSAVELDNLTLVNVAHNLHYRFEQGTDAADIADYASRLLRLTGYNPDELNLQAALQTWQQMYPSDQLLEAPQAQSHLVQQNDYVNPPMHEANFSGDDSFLAGKLKLKEYNPGHFGKGIVWMNDGDEPSIIWRIKGGWNGEPHHDEVMKSLDMKGVMVAFHIDKEGRFYFHKRDEGFGHPKDPEALSKAIEYHHGAKGLKWGGEWVETLEKEDDSRTGKVRRTEKPQKCKWCDNPAMKSLLWAEGIAYIPTCDEHEQKTRHKIEKDNNDEVVGVHTIRQTNVLYHYTDFDGLENWMDPSHTGPGYTHLTKSASNSDNPDIPFKQGIRISIDSNQLNPELFSESPQYGEGNYLYNGVVPQAAIIKIKPQPTYDWENKNVIPALETNWEAMGDDEKHHNDVSFSNDTRMLASAE